uniref:Uncharacterized protein n=1 Tax=Wuchereria bancrofti TaxID=6293 RepID=A0AAF5Q579_WUCBA
MIDLHTVYISFTISLSSLIAVGKHNERTSRWFTKLFRQFSFAVRERYVSEVINFCHE